MKYTVDSNSGNYVLSSPYFSSPLSISKKEIDDVINDIDNRFNDYTRLHGIDYRVTSNRIEVYCHECNEELAYSFSSNTKSMFVGKLHEYVHDHDNYIYEHWYDSFFLNSKLDDLLGMDYLLNESKVHIFKNNELHISYFDMPIDWFVAFFMMEKLHHDKFTRIIDNLVNYFRVVYNDDHLHHYKVKGYRYVKSLGYEIIIDLDIA